MSQESSSDSQHPSLLSEWFWIILTFLLFIFCAYSPWIAFWRFGSVWGLLASISAFFLWVWRGPAPMPGLLPGLMAMWVLTSNVFCGLASVVTVIKHFVHHVVWGAPVPDGKRSAGVSEERRGQALTLLGR